MNKPIVVELPFPPSVNHYWMMVGRRQIISKRGREYAQQVLMTVLATKANRKLTARLAVRIAVYPPDRRRRDIDNLLKATLDALCKAGVYADDEQIDDIRIKRFKVVPNGAVVVSVREVE